MATPRRPDAGLTFGCSCPGCGADLEFRDSLWVTTCTHCESTLRIVMPSGIAAWVARATKSISQIRFLIDRYCREHGLTAPGHDLLLKQLYYPYWKVDASLLKVRTRSETRIYANEADPSADVEETKDIRAVTLTPYTSAFGAGPTSDSIPDTLGLRAVYLRLFPFAEPYRDPQFDVVAIVKSPDSVTVRVRKGLTGLDIMEAGLPGANATQLLHPAFSIVYFPYIIAENYSGTPYRLTVDGVTGKVISHAVDSSTNEIAIDEPPIPADPQTVFVEPHRCATCGADFATNRSLVYLCRTCGAWTMLGSCAGAVSSVEWRQGTERDAYLPFWGFQIPDSDQGRIASMLGYHRPITWLVVPAFEIPNAEASYRLALRVTGSDLFSEQFSPIDSDVALHPITVELADAATLVDVVLIRAALERQVRPMASPFEPTAIRLLALPFHPESYFWVDSLLGVVTVERAAVSV